MMLFLIFYTTNWKVCFYSSKWLLPNHLFQWKSNYQFFSIAKQNTFYPGCPQEQSINSKHWLYKVQTLFYVENITRIPSEAFYYNLGIFLCSFYAAAVHNSLEEGHAQGYLIYSILDPKFGINTCIS